VAVALVSIGVAGCGGTPAPKPDTTYTAPATTSAMQAAGWRASAVRGMPHTVTGTEQVAYLQTTTPAGRRIDVQFLKGPSEAAGEGAAAQKRLKGFKAVVIGIALAFTPASGRVAIPAADRAALRRLLR